VSNNLSVFYVTRNDADTIEKSISSIRNISSEIIIIDLGSVDNTVALCRKLGCSIYKYKWDGNASKANNFAISKCRKDSILHMYPNEILELSGVGLIDKILSNGKSIKTSYMFDIKESVNDWVANNPKVKKNASSSIRMFPKSDRIKYTGIKNSSVEKSIVNSSNIVIKGSSCSLIKKNRKDAFVKEDSSHRVSDNLIARENKPSIVTGRCAIVMVVYNAFRFSKECFNHIVQNTNSPYKIYVINNGSTESQVHDYFSSVSDIEYIKLDVNGGVGKGRNVGIQEALKDKLNKYICLIDSDTKPSKGWLSPMTEFLSNNKDCSMVGPITNACTGHQNLVKNSWVSKYDKQTIINMSKTNGSFSECSYLDRFCQVFRRDLISKVGILEENFGLIGWEDLDFCKRIVQAGLKMHISGASYVFHTWHASTRYNGMSYPLEVKKSSKAYHKKWNRKIVAQKEIEDADKVDSSVRDNPETSVIVLTYNNLEINKRFFENFQKFTNNYELIVIDNGSTDGTVEYLESLTCINRLIKNSTNQGVIKARNLGLKLSTNPYVVCLDNDQIVKNNWLFLLHKEMGQGYDFVGVEAWEMSDRHLMPKKRHVIKRSGIKIDYVGAGGCLMKKSVLEDIGIYDERFGMAYYEDPDLCYRAKEAGYKIGWCHRNIINHLEHQTLIKGQRDFNFNEELKSSQAFFFEKVTNKRRGEKYVENMLSDKIKEPFEEDELNEDFAKDKHFVLAVTTFDRISYLKECIKTWDETRNKSAKWTLIIADDGSSRYALKYISELKIRGVEKIVIKNKRRGVHHQTNSIINKLSNMDFDVCFKIDDDVFFKRDGWDLLYYKEILKTGLEHLVLYQNEWFRSKFYKSMGNLVSRASIQEVQGAFYTITPSIIDSVGYFDTEQFGFSGLGHIDYTARCCLSGFNELKNVYDVKGSNTYIKLQPRETYKPAIPMVDRNRENTVDVIRKKKRIINGRKKTFIPYKDINAIHMRFKR
jgi:GT2 family glycosyltransferase